MREISAFTFTCFYMFQLTNHPTRWFSNWPQRFTDAYTERFSALLFFERFLLKFKSNMRNTSNCLIFYLPFFFTEKNRPIYEVRKALFLLRFLFGRAHAPYYMRGFSSLFILLQRPLDAARDVTRCLLNPPSLGVAQFFFGHMPEINR